MLDQIKKVWARPGKEIQDINARLSTLHTLIAEQEMTCQTLALRLVTEDSDAVSSASESVEAEEELSRLVMERSRLEKAKIAAQSQDGVRTLKQKAQDAENRERRKALAHDKITEAATAFQAATADIEQKAGALHKACAGYAEFSGDLASILNMAKTILAYAGRSIGVRSELSESVIRTLDRDLTHYIPQLKKEKP